MPQFTHTGSVAERTKPAFVARTPATPCASTLTCAMPSAPAVKRWPPASTAAPAAGAIVVVALNSESNVTPYWTTRTPKTWPCAADGRDPR